MTSFIKLCDYADICFAKWLICGFPVENKIKWENKRLMLYTWQRLLQPSGATCRWRKLAWLRGWKQSHDLCAYPEYHYDRPWRPNKDITWRSWFCLRDFTSSRTFSVTFVYLCAGKLSCYRRCVRAPRSVGGHYGVPRFPPPSPLDQMFSGEHCVRIFACWLSPRQLEFFLFVSAVTVAVSVPQRPTWYRGWPSLSTQLCRGCRPHPLTLDVCVCWRALVAHVLFIFHLWWRRQCVPATISISCAQKNMT